ncbi:MAG: hypothetical protein Q9227_004730 [Pyrenula ochraceoflavens]
MPKEKLDRSGIEYYTIPSFKFTSGLTLPNVKVAYKQLNPTGTKVALIPTCYGGFINYTGTFTSTTPLGEPATVKPGALDSWRIVLVAMFGNGESESPSTRPDFPKEIVYDDLIHAQYSLVTEHLGIKHLDAVIGFSMGGQQAYYWAAMYPDFVSAAVPICSSARTSPHNIAFLEGPIAALTQSADYADGQYRAKGIEPERGLVAFGRVYAAWLTSAEWYQKELWKEMLGNKDATLEDWIREFSEGNLSWDAEDHLCLARMWQKGDIGKINGKQRDYREVLRDVVKAKVLVMPCTTDQYFRVEAGEEEAKALGKKGVFAPIESCWGHAAGGGQSCKDDAEFMNKRISELLNSS